MFHGRCLCEKVQFELHGPVEEAHHCHCSMCRRAHGAAFATYARFATSCVKVLTGADVVVHYRSSGPVRRGFCGCCGSNLFYLHDAAPQFTFVCAAALGDVDVGADAHVFMASPAAFFRCEDGLARHDDQRPEYRRAPR